MVEVAAGGGHLEATRLLLGNKGDANAKPANRSELHIPSAGGIRTCYSYS